MVARCRYHDEHVRICLRATAAVALAANADTDTGNTYQLSIKAVVYLSKAVYVIHFMILK